MTDANAMLAEADNLRERLVDKLVDDCAVLSTAVETAFRTAPRHLFAPTVPLEQAYTNDIVRTTPDRHGGTTGSISAPWLQALMLEQAGIGPGMRCLEIGSGTRGYNAALMAELASPTGQVTTVDTDPGITNQARLYLAKAGYGRVNVVLADPEHGVAEHAPCDRIIVTVEVWDIPPAWMDQLTERGRIVVPLRIRGLSRSVAFVRYGDHLVSLGHVNAGVVPVQGAGAHPERLVPLHGGQVGLRIDDGLKINAGALRAALCQPSVRAWSGVRFGDMEPFDDLFLWLGTCLDQFCLLTRAPTDATQELVNPASPAGTPTLVGDRGFAYLTFRKAEPHNGLYEFGAHGHGPDAGRLAETMVEQVRVWNRQHRHGPDASICLYPADTPPSKLPHGRVIDKRHTKLTVSWP